jgi:hypothetical protein
MAFRQLAEQGIGDAAEQAVQQALEKGWLLADEGAIAGIQDAVDRPLKPRARGRPRLSCIKMP